MMTEAEVRAYVKDKIDISVRNTIRSCPGEFRFCDLDSNKMEKLREIVWSHYGPIIMESYKEKCSYFRGDDFPAKR